MTIETTHRDSVAARLAAIPEEKLSTMIARTFIGALFVVFGVLIGMGKLFTGLPVLVSYGTVIFGAIMASGQLMTHPFRLFVAFVRDILAAIRDRSTPAP